MKISFLIEKEEEIGGLLYRIKQAMLDPDFRRILIIMDTTNVHIKLRQDTVKVGKRKKIKKFNKNYSERTVI